MGLVSVLLLSTLAVATTTTTTTTITATATATATAVCPPAQAAPPGTVPGERIAVYFTNWGIYEANFQPQDLLTDEITHVHYAFADIGPDGEVKSSDSWADLEKTYDGDSQGDSGKNVYGCVKQLNILKRKNRNLKVLLSIGGWSYRSKFALPASTEAGRQRFASSAVKLLADWGLDGLDVDWEYPENEQQAQDYVSLLRACREALDEYAAQHAPDYHFLLAVASPAGAQNYEIMDLAAMDALVDIWNVMTYDYAGQWDSTSGHQANVYPRPENPESTKFDSSTTISAYMNHSIEASKINLGIPLYGRSFLNTDGLGKNFTDVGAGSIEKGVWLYKDLPRPGAEEYVDTTAVASYSYDPKTKELVSYDTVVSTTQKAEWILNKTLGGAFFWEASGDRKGNGSLIQAVAAILAPEGRLLQQSPNLISYPMSQYDNIRNSTEET